MSVAIDAVNPSGSWLEINLHGEWCGSDCLHFLPEVLTTIRSRNLRRVLLDFSEVRAQTRILFEHEFGEFLRLELPRRVLFALVMPTCANGNVACFESVARAQGPHLRVFASYGAAANWLEELDAQFAPDPRGCIAAGQQ